MSNRRKTIWAASVMSVNLARLEDELKALEQAGCDELHFDVTDGLFAPGFTLGVEIVKAARRSCHIACAAHLMISRPEDYIEQFVEAGCSVVTVNAEACIHAHRTLGQIREAGAQAGIALKPATPLTKVDYLLDNADRVVVMMAEPGGLGPDLSRAAAERVKILRENIEHGERAILIEVEGNISVENAALLSLAGADVFDLDSPGIFGGGNLGENFESFKNKVVVARELL